MINLDDLLKNDTVKDLLKKAGVDDKQAKSITSQAMKTVKEKFDKDPKQMSSLLSENDNTDDDNKLAASAENDFLSSITDKLPDGIGDKLKGFMPVIISQFTGKADGESGIAGMLGGLTDMFDGDDDDDKGGSKKKSSGGGFLGMIKGLFGGK